MVSWYSVKNKNWTFRAVCWAQGLERRLNRRPEPRTKGPAGRPKSFNFFYWVSWIPPMVQIFLPKIFVNTTIGDQIINEIHFTKWKNYARYKDKDHRQFHRECHHEFVVVVKGFSIKTVFYWGLFLGRTFGWLLEFEGNWRLVNYHDPPIPPSIHLCNKKNDFKKAD